MIDASDEYFHPDAATIPGALFGDTAWFSVMDRQAGIFGVVQLFFSNHGYARWASLFQIDGTLQYWGNKQAFGGEPARGPWTDGRMRYEVIRPLEEFRVTFDGPLYAYDLAFSARYPAFAYEHGAEPTGLTAPSEYFSMVGAGTSNRPWTVVATSNCAAGRTAGRSARSTAVPIANVRGCTTSTRRRSGNAPPSRRFPATTG